MSGQTPPVGWGGQEAEVGGSTSSRPALEPAFSGAAGLDVINDMIQRQVCADLQLAFF